MNAVLIYKPDATLRKCEAYDFVTLLPEFTKPENSEEGAGHES
jgi:hypothetical protein